MRRLILPTTSLHASWLAARDEWGRGVHQPGAGLWRADGRDLDSPEGFAAWVERLHHDADPNAPLPGTLVHATWALGAVLGKARIMALARVLVTCDDDNEASRRTIERHGGVLEDVRDTDEGVKRRYWIPLGPSEPLPGSAVAEGRP